MLDQAVEGQHDQEQARNINTIIEMFQYPISCLGLCAWSVHAHPTALPVPEARSINRAWRAGFEGEAINGMAQCIPELQWRY